ncbi:uncharacterized protein TNCV_1755061 [Trichonephila clavipes]|nr:uncharacterized protein TNCV_1755061 [Trichonephila clavipes]
MKSLPIAAAYGRTYGSRISSRYLRPVMLLHGTHAGQCGHRARSLPKPGIPTTSITVSFNSVGLMVSSALFPQIRRRPESLSIVNLDSSVNSTEAHCCCVKHVLLPSISGSFAVVR